MGLRKHHTPEQITGFQRKAEVNLDHFFQGRSQTPYHSSTCKFKPRLLAISGHSRDYSITSTFIR